MIGIVTFAYGAPKSLDDIEAYHTHISHGKKQPKKINQMKNQYRHMAVGDTLGSVSKRQIEALAQALQAQLNKRVKGYVAYKHTAPFTEDVIRQMVADGVTKIITFPIKALYSKSGFVYYQVLVRNALKELAVDIPVLDIEGWHDHPSIVHVLSDRVRTAWNFLPGDVKEDSQVIFTSHSLPGKPATHQAFEEQFTELAGLIAKQANIPKWRISYRSAGTHADVWLGPDIQEVIEMEADAGTKGIVVCELLTLTSNLEASYDIGYDIQPICKRKDIEFFQTAMVDDSFDFIMALAQIVLDKLEEEDFLTAGL